MKGLVFVKLGGSLITDKSRPYTVRQEVIRRLAYEIRQTRQGRPLLVAHGGGSFPHVSASKYGIHRGVINDKSWEGFARVANDAATLNRIVVSELIGAGENAFSIQPSASCFAKGGRITEWYARAVETALEKGLIPVPYGDACLDEKMGCCIISTEEIFRFLAEKLKPERLIMAGKTEGVMDSKGLLIKEITKKNFKELEKSFRGSDGVADVTGGMVQKVKLSLETGVETEIINGLREGLLKRSLMGEKGLGTLIRG